MILINFYAYLSNALAVIHYLFVVRFATLSTFAFLEHVSGQ